MKHKRIALWLGGILLFLSVIATFAWFLSPAPSEQPKELTLDEALVLIKKNEVSEVLVKADSLELTDKNKKKFYSKLDSSDATRNILLGTIDDINKEKPGSIKTSLEQASSGFFNIMWISTLPFFIMWAITLGVVIWAVKTLTRNKG